ncbi:MAG: glycosyltransferase family 2 protein [Verrucomicrobiota bacterium]|jgi:polyisoprenyl-phosphate glycosyltransferase
MEKRLSLPTVFNLVDTTRYSVVIPVCNEQENLPELYRRLLAVLQPLNEPYEIIFIDDGSHDNSATLIRALAAENCAVHALFLSRNFGHQAALSAGMDHSRGAAVIAMDADLQDPPEIIPQLIARWRQGFQVVYAVRKKRKEPLLKRMAYLAFYRLLHGLADLDIPVDAGDFSLIDRQVVNILRKMPERNRFIRGLRSWIGFRQCGLEYEREARHAGEPKYTFTRLLKLAFDGFLSFSYVPLRLAFWLGLVSFVLCLVYIGYAIYTKFVFGTNPPGWTSLMIAVMLLGSVQLVLIGIVGEYIARIYDEVKQRPFYIVGEKIDGA